MPLTSTVDITAAVGSNYQRGKVTVTLDLPGLSGFDITANLASLQADGANTTSYPTDLTDQSGECDWGGTLVLHPRRDDPYDLLVLFNPDDPASPLYRQNYIDSPITISVGLYPPGSDVAGMVDYPAFVKEIEYDRVAGSINVHFNNVHSSWNNLPDGLRAVLTPPPFNAGLTNEFVIDRIARSFPVNAKYTWPAQRVNCFFAAGYRSSVAAEVGDFNTAIANNPQPLFKRGVFGSAWVVPKGNMYYAAPNTVPGSLFMEFWMTGMPSDSLWLQLGPNSASGGVSLFVTPTYLQLLVHDSQGSSFNPSWNTRVDSGPHYIAVALNWPKGSTSPQVTFYLDGASHTSSVGTLAANNQAFYDFFIQGQGDGTTIEGLQASIEDAPVINYGFTPTAFLDPSLNSLGVVPAIDKGADAWQELQTVAESEGGWIGLRGRNLVFLNRDTIMQQAPSRAVTVDTDLLTQGSDVGQSTPYDDVAIDFTAWTFSQPKQVFTPGAVWKIPAGRTVTFERSLPSGQTASIVDGSISYLPAGHSTNDGNSWARYSLDRFGNGEFPAGLIDASVEAVTPSRLRLTFTNHDRRRDAFTAAPDTQTDIPAGTPSVWIGGRLATPDNPTTLHVTYGTPSNTYSAPTNPYRQNQDDTLAWGQQLLKMLRNPPPAYTNVVMKLDPRTTPPDKLTLDVLTAAGVQPTDVLVFTASMTIDFEQKTCEMPLDIRAVAPPGAWLLGTPGRSELGGAVGSLFSVGTAFAY